jgi:23S rRNA (uracil1939-C5)-methyltransferase
MSLMASQKAKTVIGIESVKDAVENAKQSAERNGITNAEFICADAADGLYMAARTRHVNTLLVDPPRSGMDQKMIKAVLKVMPDKIIYVSCNPATLAKNLKDLKHDYHVVTVIPFDMFPHTPHIESVTVLEKG